MSETQEREIGQLICRLDAMGPSCVMDDHPERPPCSVKNCRHVKTARAIIKHLNHQTGGTGERSLPWLTDVEDREFHQTINVFEWPVLREISTIKAHAYTLYHDGPDVAKDLAAAIGKCALDLVRAMKVRDGATS